MASTYTPIATTTLGSAATISFTSIPSTYTDLKLVITGTTTANGVPYIYFNGDNASTTYSSTSLYGDGSSAFSGKLNNDFAIEFPNGTGSLVNLLTWDIFSYAGSTYKTVLANRSNDRNGSGYVESIVGMWRNTAAITSIGVTPTGTTFASGTTATLYGIKAA